MTRQTSIETYNQIKNNGLLSRLRFLVYSTIFEKGPMTMAEAADLLKMGSKSVSPRFAELEKIGVISPVGRKICNVSGRDVISWETTDNLPIKLERPERIKCKACDGLGFHETTQTKLF